MAAWKCGAERGSAEEDEAGRDHDNTGKMASGIWENCHHVTKTKTKKKTLVQQDHTENLVQGSKHRKRCKPPPPLTSLRKT